MTKIKSAENAFAIAKDIRILMGELLEAVEELSNDESISSQQRHLTLKQVIDFYSDRDAELSKVASTFLEEKVEKDAVVKVPGFHLGDRDELYVSGMVYNYKPTHKIEILNKDDDDAWGTLIVALVKAGYAKAIQKRLTVSHFVGPNGEAALMAAAGLINCSTEGSWSITKPKPTKK